jgi:HK97 gp10 family phage protein
VSQVHTVASWFVELSREPVKVQQEASAIVRAAAFLCQRTAAQRVPVDTGFLRSSITVGDPNGGPLRPNALAAQVGPEANYGYWVEFGNSRGAKPQPYMTPAAEQAGEWFANAMTRDVGIR